MQVAILVERFRTLSYPHLQRTQAARWSLQKEQGAGQASCLEALLCAGTHTPQKHFDAKPPVHKAIIELLTYFRIGPALRQIVRLLVLRIVGPAPLIRGHRLQSS